MANEIEKKDLIEDINKKFEMLKETNDKRIAEEKKNGEALGETKEKLEKIEKAMEELDMQMKRADIVVETKESKEKEEVKKANDIQVKFYRYGFDGLNEEERKYMLAKKDMISSNNTTGGFLITPDSRNEIIKNIVEYSPVRQVARVTTTSKNEIKIPVRSGNITGGAWAGEVADRTDLGNITYGMLNIPVHTLTGYVDISRDNLDDSDFDLAREINMELAEQFGVTEGGVFLSGNGVNKPEGILSNSSVAEVVSGSASAITADGLYDLVFALKTYYTRNAMFMLERTTIRDIRKLKDGNGNYLWKPGLADGSPASILGYRYVEATDMPTISANAYPVLFGDFKEGYQIVDRKMMTMERDDITQRLNNLVRFYATKRVGGQVRKAEAIKKLKISV